MNNLKILILAAGEGTRMKSSVPKVLHEAAGKSLIKHVLDVTTPLKGETGIVVGKGGEEVKNRLQKKNFLRFFTQKNRLGSGHAVRMALSWLRGKQGNLLILCGDAPLIKSETLRQLVSLHKKQKNVATLLSAHVPNPTGYGRIVRNKRGIPEFIIEEREATAAQKDIHEINSGTYCFRIPDFLRVLAKIRSNNSKGEYYITDAISLLVKERAKIGALCLKGETEVLGVNTPQELIEADQVLRFRILDRLMKNGVRVIDPFSTFIDAKVKIGSGTFIYPQTFLQGETSIGKGSSIGPFSFIKNSRIGNSVELRASFLYDSIVGDYSQIGPYSHLRPGTIVKSGARIGNFVETKKSNVGRHSKVSHLTYLGDTDVGDEVNIGAGVITCNYDGSKKYKTQIGRGSFVGSNVNLVAPVRIGQGATIGAGSTITKNVPSESLALERTAQVIKRGWSRKVKQKRSKNKK